MIETFKPTLKISDIELLLNGKDPQEGIKYIDVSYYSNEAKIFIRKKEDKEVSLITDPFRPFIWFKGFDFDKDFCWKYFFVLKKDFDEESGSFLDRGNVRFLDGELELVGESPDEKELFLREFIPNIEDRKKLCYQKMKEYNVEIKETITSFDKNKTVDRMENGFKYLVHINRQEEDKFYMNPVLSYTQKGKLKRITGTFANLIDFFAEGGIDIRKKSGIFLDEYKFDLFWKTATNVQKLLFFLSIPFKNLFFSIVEMGKESSLLDEIENNHSEYDKIELSDFIFAHFNERIKGEKCFDFLYKQIVKEKNYQFVFDNEKELGRIISLKVDGELLRDTLDNDYTFDSRKGFKELNTFLKDNGINIFHGEERLFFNISPLEQYMIQSGKRLFKGFEEYSDLRIMTMDIETKALQGHESNKRAALSAFTGRIFKIGITCNNGLEEVLEAETDRQEKESIEQFFEILKETEPDIFITYNGEAFDFPFILKRYELLCRLEDEGKTLEKIREIMGSYFEKFNTYLYKRNFFNRHAGNLKVGGSNTKYVQTDILGINLCDTMFAVKRAMAINKAIPNAKLKDNIKFANLAKKNRVYVDGDKIGATENSPSTFYLNESNGDWLKYHKEILFEDNEYSSNKVKKKGLNTNIYGDESCLYVWDKLCGDDSILSDCQNTFEFNVNLENLSEYDTFFQKIYLKFRNYDKIVFRKKHIGVYLKEENTKGFEYLKSKLSKLRSDLSCKECFYPEKDFSDYTVTTGKEIVKRYLIDDLYETIALDEHYSQATFLISKWLPTSYQRAATIGGASVWKLLLSMYSYEYGLAIPEFDEPREFSGGLVAMLSCGWHGASFKGDFSSLYPAVFHEHIKSPEIDLLRVYKLFMYYGWQTRVKYKKLMNEARANGDEKSAKKWDVKQLPIKILINSFYGMMGAAGVTPFADLLSAQGITCNGRQQLRHFIKWFTERGFTATIAHTDGVFFSYGTADLSYKYVGRGKNWLVTKDKEYIGIAAYVAEYNDLYLKGIMGLDIDEIVKSVINFSKGNYVYLKNKKDKDGKEKEVFEVVGGAIIKKNQSEYISEFSNEMIMKLLQNKPLEALNYYWDYVKKIHDYKIETKKIASKAKIKKTKEEYLQHITGKNKNGAALNRQVYMELLIQNSIDFEVDDYVYYINSGLSKKDKDSQSVSTRFGSMYIENVDMRNLENLFKLNDRKKIKDFLIKSFESGNFVVNEGVLDGDFYAILENIEKWKDIKHKIRVLKKGTFIDFIKVEYNIGCSLVDPNDENFAVQYNRDLYIHKLNSAIHPLFICFKPEIREKLIIDSPSNKPFLLEKDLELINNIPFNGDEDSQTNYNDVMILPHEELEYWEMVNTSPDDFMNLNN